MEHKLIDLLHEYFIGHVGKRESHGFFTLYPTGSKLQNDIGIFLIYARGLMTNDSRVAV